MGLKKRFTEKEIEYLEGLWTAQNLSAQDGWDFVEESLDNLAELAYNKLKPFYQESGMSENEAERRIQEILYGNA